MRELPGTIDHLLDEAFAQDRQRNSPPPSLVSPAGAGAGFAAAAAAGLQLGVGGGLAQPPLALLLDLELPAHADALRLRADADIVVATGRAGQQRRAHEQAAAFEAQQLTHLSMQHGFPLGNDGLPNTRLLDNLSAPVLHPRAVNYVAHEAFADCCSRQYIRQVGGVRLAPLHANASAGGSVADIRPPRHMIITAIFADVDVEAQPSSRRSSASRDSAAASDYAGGLCKLIQLHLDCGVTLMILVDGSLLLADFDRICAAADTCPAPVQIVGASFMCDAAHRPGTRHAHVELLPALLRLMPLMLACSLTAHVIDCDAMGLIAPDQRLARQLRSMRERGDDFHNIAGVLLAFHVPDVNLDTQVVMLARAVRLADGGTVHGALGRLIWIGGPLSPDWFDQIVRHSELCQDQECAAASCLAAYSASVRKLVEKHPDCHDKFRYTGVDGGCGRPLRQHFEYSHDERFLQMLIKREMALAAPSSRSRCTATSWSRQSSSTLATRCTRTQSLGAAGRGHLELSAERLE